MSAAGQSTGGEGRGVEGFHPPMVEVGVIVTVVGLVGVGERTARVVGL
jgi:hypothetical protein